MYLNNRIIAWDIAFHIMSRSRVPLMLTMLHPGGEQYACLATLPLDADLSDKHLLINLNGTSIHAGLSSDLVRPYPELHNNNKEDLLNEIAKHCGYILEDKKIHDFDSMRFLIDLISQDKEGGINIYSAWYDGSYECCIMEHASRFPYYEHKNEKNDATPHIPWWVITNNNHAIAMCNLETDELITILGKRYDLKTEKKEASLAMKSISQNYNHEPRGITRDFENDLIRGILHPILIHVLNDDNLTLEIRRKYINIYYRGGNLVRIREKASKHSYSFEFDIRYIQENSSEKCAISALPGQVIRAEDVDKWIFAFPKIKSEMDRYFAERTKLEREYEQLVVRENNRRRSAKSTDYFICDIEYQVNETRFDLIAAKRLSRGKFRLALVEMKYLDGALSGKSGVIDHVKKAYDYLCNHDLLLLKSEMKEILETKRQLGIIDNLPEKIEFTDEKPEFVFLLANHKPASSILETELQSLKKQDFYVEFNEMADLKIALANYMGYGLYNDCVYSLDEFEMINRTMLDILSRRRS